MYIYNVYIYIYKMFTLDLIIKSGAVFSHFKPKVQLPTIHCHSMFKDLACSTCIHLLPMSKLIMCAYFVRFLGLSESEARNWSPTFATAAWTGCPVSA